MPKPAPVPAFRGYGKKVKYSDYTEEKYQTIVKDAKEKSVRGDLFKDERLLTHLHATKTAKARNLRMMP